MPAANDDWVRSVCLSKIIATVRGPASGLASYGACLSSTARSRTCACSAGVRSSSRRKCAHHDAPIASSRIAGQAARSALASSSVSTSGGASRIRLGVGVVDDEAGRLGGGDHLGRGVGRQVEADQQALAADLGDPRVGGETVAELLAEHGDVLEQVVVLDRADHGERGGAGDRVAAERGAVVAGLRAGRRPRRAPMQAPIGKPPPRPLATVTMSGATPSRGGRTTAPVRPMPDCTSSSQSSAPCSSAIARAAAR